MLVGGGEPVCRNALWGQLEQSLPGQNGSLPILQCLHDLGPVIIYASLVLVGLHQACSCVKQVIGSDQVTGKQAGASPPQGGRERVGVGLPGQAQIVSGILEGDQGQGPVSILHHFQTAVIVFQVMGRVHVQRGRRIRDSQQHRKGGWTHKSGGDGAHHRRRGCFKGHGGANRGGCKSKAQLDGQGNSSNNNS